jgi:transcription elongation factor SPT4
MAETGYLRNGAVFPDKLRQLRACLSCKLIKTSEQWRAEGCENCSDKFHGIDSFSYTTPTFQGTIVMMKPGKSWVARWQKQENFKAGMYAIQVTGTAPEEEGYDAE